MTEHVADHVVIGALRLVLEAGGSAHTKLAVITAILDRAEPTDTAATELTGVLVAAIEETKTGQQIWISESMLRDLAERDADGQR